MIQGYGYPQYPPSHVLFGHSKSQPLSQSGYALADCDLQITIGDAGISDISYFVAPYVLCRIALQPWYFPDRHCPSSAA